MPEFIVMYGNSAIGRLKCTADFVSVFSNKKRMELSGGFIMKPGISPELVELFVSPIASSDNPTLTDEEREAVKLATDFLEDEFYGCSDKCKAEHEAVATLRKLLERHR